MSAVSYEINNFDLILKTCWLFCVDRNTKYSILSIERTDSLSRKGPNKKATNSIGT